MLSTIIGLATSKLVPAILAGVGALGVLLTAFFKGRKSGLRTAEKKNKKVRAAHGKLSRKIDLDTASMRPKDIDKDLERWTK